MCRLTDVFAFLQDDIFRYAYAEFGKSSS